MKTILLSLLLCSVSFGGVIQLDTPAITEPPRKFNLWEATQVYGLISYSFDTEEFGGGVRLAYDVNDHVKIRADYSSTDFTASQFGADSSLSLAFLYPVDAVPGLHLYTITGVGVSDFESPALELIAGVGVEYEVKSFTVFTEYQYNSEDEDSVARLGVGITF